MSENTRVCEGCGGRNRPDATECDWCARPFTSSVRRLGLTGWHGAGVALVVLAALALAALGVLNAGRPLGALPAIRPPTLTVSAATPPSATPAVTPRVRETPTPTPPPTLTPLPVAAGPAATPTPQQRTAVVANTSGSGVSIRRDPGSQATAVGTLREGATVRLTGAEQTIAARLWREVEVPDSGLKGWVSADFLDPR